MLWRYKHQNLAEHIYKHSETCVWWNQKEQNVPTTDKISRKTFFNMVQSSLVQKVNMYAIDRFHCIASVPASRWPLLTNPNIIYEFVWTHTSMLSLVLVNQISNIIDRFHRHISLLIFAGCLT